MFTFRTFAKKAPLIGAFFIAGLFASPGWSLCSLDSSLGKAQTVVVARVFDGDTVELKDGRKVRLIGVNTPEMEYRGKLEQPLAAWSKVQLQRLMEQQPIKLVPGKESKDRHGRLLAYLYGADGVSISAQLIKLGAGFQVAFPPNLTHFDCFAEAEKYAQERELGVWGDPYFKPIASDSDKLEGGYVRVVGAVEKVTRTKKFLWVELEGDVVLKLEKRFSDYFKGPLFDQVNGFSRRSQKKGPTIEVRGWLYDRLSRKGYTAEKVKQGKRKRFQMQIRHGSGWRAL